MIVGDNICHFTSVRMRVVGVGDLKMTYYSLDEAQSITLVPFTLAATTPVIPTRLTNFMQQQAKLRIKTTEFGEHFRLTRLTIFMKPVFTEYPM